MKKFIASVITLVLCITTVCSSTVMGAPLSPEPANVSELLADIKVANSFDKLFEEGAYTARVFKLVVTLYDEGTKYKQESNYYFEKNTLAGLNDQYKANGFMLTKYYENSDLTYSNNHYYVGGNELSTFTDNNEYYQYSPEYTNNYYYNDTDCSSILMEFDLSKASFVKNTAGYTIKAPLIDYPDIEGLINTDESGLLTSITTASSDVASVSAEFEYIKGVNTPLLENDKYQSIKKSFSDGMKDNTLKTMTIHKTDNTTEEFKVPNGDKFFYDLSSEDDDSMLDLFYDSEHTQSARLLFTKSITTDLDLYVGDWISHSIGIASTNSLYGHVEPVEDVSFGMAQIKNYKTIAGYNRDLGLLIDGGNMFCESLFSLADNGESMAKLTKSTGYDSIMMGSIDWINTPTQLNKLEELSGADFLCGNVSDSKGKKVFDNDYTIKEIPIHDYDHDLEDGKKLYAKVGIFGVIDPEEFEAYYSTCMADYKASDVVKYTEDIVKELNDQGCNIIIGCIYSENAEEYVKKTSGVSLWINGSDEKISKMVNNSLDIEVPLTSCEPYGAGVALTSIDFMYYVSAINDDNSLDFSSYVTDSETEYFSAVGSEIVENASVKSTYEELLLNQKKITDRIIGHLDKELNVTYKDRLLDDTDIGRICTDAILRKTGSVAAFLDASAITYDDILLSGDVTMGDVIKLFPYKDNINTIEVTGAQIKQMLEKSINHLLENKLLNESSPDLFKDKAYSGILYLGGMIVKYDDTKANGKRVWSIICDNKEINASEKYIIAINDYAYRRCYSTIIGSSKIIKEYGSCDLILAEYFIADTANGKLISSSRSDIRLINEAVPIVRKPEEIKKQEKPDETVETKKPVSSDKTVVHSPETSDTNNYYMYITLMMFSFLCIYAITKIHKKSLCD